MNTDELIADALPIMTAEVAAHAQKLNPPAPLAHLKFWYYDTCAPACYLLAHALTRIDRDRILKREGNNAGGKLWDGAGTIEFGVGVSDDSPCRPLFAIAYQMMCMDATERRAENLTGDATIMSRLLSQSLSRHLNNIDWGDLCPVTDDFIVYAQNGTDYGCDCYEDLIECVPQEKLDCLRLRGLMGPGERYAIVPAAQDVG